MVANDDDMLIVGITNFLADRNVEPEHLAEASNILCKLVAYCSILFMSLPILM